ncbi:hypothetical protein [Sphingopyxis flava]|uniref:Uncharacterized protein n=1 Tax=Sphingopyxis flava TaxID=1507287 RepID=A0A1T5B4U1_9SPHN|nr:hypothetical protein [Sphingopyxis flava]SKB42274.1 hypothetical protein SAMN06295937_1005150 [Sphingopyxis flava]
MLAKPRQEEAPLLDMLLFRRASGVSLFLKGKQHDVVALSLASAIDQQILCGAAKETAGIEARTAF